MGMLSEEDKGRLQGIIYEMIARNLETLDDAYEKALQGLPKEQLERMTDADRVSFMEKTINEAVRSIEEGSKLLVKEVEKTVASDETMERIRNEVMGTSKNDKE